MDVFGTTEKQPETRNVVHEYVNTHKGIIRVGKSPVSVHGATKSDFEYYLDRTLTMNEFESMVPEQAEEALYRRYVVNTGFVTIPEKPWGEVLTFIVLRYPKPKTIIKVLQKAIMEIPDITDPIEVDGVIGPETRKHLITISENAELCSSVCERFVEILDELFSYLLKTAKLKAAPMKMDEIRKRLGQ